MGEWCICKGLATTSTIEDEYVCDDVPRCLDGNALVRTVGCGCLGSVGGYVVLARWPVHRIYLLMRWPRMVVASRGDAHVRRATDIGGSAVRCSTAIVRTCGGSDSSARFCFCCFRCCFARSSARDVRCAVEM